MKFLAKVASLVMKGVTFLEGFQPYVSDTNPSAKKIWDGAEGALNKIAKIVADIEVVGQGFKDANGNVVPLTGEQKLAAAFPLATQVLRDSGLLSGHQIDDEIKFNAAAKGITSNIVDLLNSLKTDNIKTTETPV